METAKIRENLHESIENIEDKSFLLAIKEILNRKYITTDNLKITSWQKERILEPEIQIKNGEYYPDDLIIESE